MHDIEVNKRLQVMVFFGNGYDGSGVAVIFLGRMVTTPILGLNICFQCDVTCLSGRLCV